MKQHVALKNWSVKKMNKVNLIGRLTSKPELRTVGSDLNTTRFTLAVNRTFSNSQGEKEADFITIVAWKKQAENICKYLDKGSQLAISGRIQTGSYDTEDGNKKYTTEVIAEQVMFLDSKKETTTKPETLDDFSEFGNTVLVDEDFLD